MYDYIRTIVPEERLLFHEPMNRHTTFRVGGEAECMAVVETQDELSQLVSYLGRIEQEYFVLGNGSNLLVGDKGYRGIVVKLGPQLSAVRVEQDHIAAGAGALLSQVAFAARDAGLSGMEFAAGIPGSIGGGIVMNAGAYGGEMKQIVKMVRVMDKEGEILTLDNDTMEFGYRTSIIRNRPFIVLGVVLKLTPGNRDEISAKMEELMKQRKSKQPLEYPSAGSTFKRVLCGQTYHGCGPAGLPYRRCAGVRETLWFCHQFRRCIGGGYQGSDRGSTGARAGSVSCPAGA